jgi:SNF2 family DNA or RNA helicase
MKLFEHQSKAIDVARDHARYLFAWDCGSGKTIALLAICRDRPMKTIVVCPKSIMSSAWVRDAQNFPEIRVKILGGLSPAKRDAAIASDWDIGIINFDQFKIVSKRLLEIGVQRLIVDESSKMKNPESDIASKLIAFSDQMRSVYLLSGTPAPNNVTEYYGQLRAIRPDIVGRVFWKWVYEVATPARAKIWTKGPGGRPIAKDVISGWSQTQAQKDTLEKQLRECSWAMRKEDALDLPEQVDMTIRFPLDDEWEAYVGAVSALRVQLADETVKIPADAALMKLRQIVGGFIIADGIPKQIGKSKIRELVEVLDSIGREPAVIWCEFRHEIDAIAALCEKRGESVEIIDGRTSSDAGEIAARFQEGKILRLICQPQAAGHGITLTAARYAIYYSIGFSYETYKQSRDRIHRAGQSRKCTYFLLVAEDTVDEACLGCVRGKGKAADALISVLSGNMNPEE